LEGRIIFIDSFGNIVTNIPSGMVEFRQGDVLEIEKKQVLFQSSYGFCKKDEPLVLIGSHGYLEIAVNQGSAAEFFDKKQGDKIIIKT
ncbi:MAG TPA: SAM hydroxide adenosyltransferase, partial [Candidatus Wunengus sp. YC60]|uniref:SAM hydroxide adenosyltransferase n=1 Tax=Candidatus Wunengus sp. YC60 TaxID=3367697 RepID=UPI004025793A